MRTGGEPGAQLDDPQQRKSGQALDGFVTAPLPQQRQGVALLIPFHSHPRHPDLEAD